MNESIEFDLFHKYSIMQILPTKKRWDYEFFYSKHVLLLFKLKNMPEVETK